MSFDGQRLLELLPTVYRLRDAEEGGPLEALLEIIGEQATALEENLQQLYDDQFVETCADWVVPYIGDLIGYRGLHGVTAKVASPRAEVANTIAFRRRKGTASMLEQLARDVTGWNARVVEFFQQLATTQYMNHIRPDNWYAPHLRLWEPMERLDTAFNSVAHTIDVRRISTEYGLYNVPNIGIFLWRIGAYSLTDSPAVALDDRRFFFSPLGHDTPLFTRPQTEDEITHLAEPINVPLPISRRVLSEYRDAYYGPGLSLLIRANGFDVDAEEIEACDLSDSGGGAWAHEPTDTVAVDPVLGRIAFPQNQDPPSAVLVTFHYGFSTAMGGGEYERAASLDGLLEPVHSVASPTSLQSAVNAMADGGVVEITDSGRYAETLAVAVNTGRRLELRAANEHRPAVILGGDFEVTGGDDADVTLNGLVIAGGPIRIPAADNALRRLRLRHCTLVPVSCLTTGGTPLPGGQPSIIVENPDVTVEIDHCIVGGVRADSGAHVRVTDSIVDSTAMTAVAFADLDDESAGATLRLEDCTVIGKVHTRLLELASNTVFVAALDAGDTWPAPVRSERRQQGCVRFSYLPEGARVPRRYRCQPDLAIQQAVDAARRDNPLLDDAQIAQIAAAITIRLQPVFTDLRFGRPAYGQLSTSCPMQIRTGAEDEAEMGAFRKLYQPQRETNLRVRLEEYLRVGLDAGILYAS